MSAPTAVKSGLRCRLPALDFLELLYGDCPRGYLPRWTLSDKATLWLPANDLETFALRSVEAAERDNVYWGIGLHDRPLGPAKRGEADTVSAIPGLWTDIDYGAAGHKSTRNPPTLDDALEIVRAFPLAFTAIVHSGHGIHAWWLFKELWRFEGEADRNDAQQLLMGFQATLQARAHALGWEIDSTFNLAQVLRLPGTHNRKPGLDPVPVQMMGQDDSARYSPDDFEPYLIDVPAWQKAAAVELPADLPKVDIDALRVAPWLKALIRDGDTDGHYDTRSHAMWNVEKALIRAGLDDATIAAVFLDPANAVGQKAREQGRGWLATDIGRARAKPDREYPVLRPARHRPVLRREVTV